jgi:hypothetical protein
VTHPFHPLFGREYELVGIRRLWGEARVYFEDDSGRLKLMPAEWTDAVAADPVVVIGAGRPLFRVEDLLRLVDLIRGLDVLGGQ